MSLQVWLPLTKDTRNQGLVNIVSSNNGVTFTNGGKLGEKYFSAGTITISASSSSSIFNGTHMSFSFWLKPVGTSGTSVIFGQSSMSAGNNRMYSIFQYPTPNDLHISWQSETSSSTFIGFSISGFFEADKWTHCALVYDGSKLLVYKNGVLNGTYNGVSTRTAFNYDYPINASSIRCLNDFRIYDHCLSPMEVKELAKGLVLHYPLNRQGWGQENLISNSQLNGSWTYPSSSYSDKYSPTTLIVPSGSVYTLSFDAKSTVNGDKIRTHYYSPNTTTTCTSNQGVVKTASDGNMDFTLTTSWKRYWVIYNQSETTAVKHIICPRLVSGNGTGTVSVRNVKFEEGSVATPWCPNSSDTLATTMGLNFTTEYDCSGFCNNGTRTGTFTWTSDTPKYAVSTTVNSSKIQCITNPITGDDPIFSIGFWFKLKSNISYIAYADLVSFSSSSYSNQPFRLEICGNPVGNDIYWFRGPSGNVGGFKINTSNLVRDTWYYTVLVSEGNKQYSYYINGIKTGTYNGSANSWIPTNIFSIGDGQAGAFDISDVRIYATALSADDVKSLYQNCATIDPDGTIRGQIRS